MNHAAAVFNNSRRISFHQLPKSHFKTNAATYTHSCSVLHFITCLSSKRKVILCPCRFRVERSCRSALQINPLPLNSMHVYMVHQFFWWQVSLCNCVGTAFFHSVTELALALPPSFAHTFSFSYLFSQGRVLSRQALESLLPYPL